MKVLNSFLRQQSEWLKGEGPYSDVVISTRCRLARNFSEVPFPARADEQMKKEVIGKIKTAKSKIPQMKGTHLLELTALSDVDRDFLIERHLMSVEHAHSPQGKALIVSGDEVLSVMINEEDHLRIQVIRSGFNLREAWQFLNDIDDQLSQNIDFAFSREWGFLTACPTNVGTGLRGSIMLHLPGLVLSKRINKLLSVITKLNFTARGLFGEGTQAVGNFFQVSNQISLGRTEEEILENIEGVTRQIIEQEREAREVLMNKQRVFLEDRIWRSYGLLKNARIISSQETLDLLSMLRLGVDMEIIEGNPASQLNKIFILIQPAHIQKIEKRVLSSQERDARRAQLVREMLK